MRIPAGFRLCRLAGLSAEVRQKLEHARPATLAQAGRMEGMTPAALMLLLAHLRKAPARVAYGPCAPRVRRPAQAAESGAAAVSRETTRRQVQRAGQVDA